MGFGPVVPEKDEPVFHADWERRAFCPLPGPTVEDPVTGS